MCNPRDFLAGSLDVFVSGNSSLYALIGKFASRKDESRFNDLPQSNPSPGVTYTAEFAESPITFAYTFEDWLTCGPLMLI